MKEARYLIWLLCLAGAVAFYQFVPEDAAYAAAAADLTVNYVTENGNSVYGLTVRVRGTGYNQTKSGVTGSATFTGLQSGVIYTITSTKGSSSRTDSTPALAAGANTFDVPCSDLVVNVKAESGDVSVNSVRVAVTAGTVETKSTVVGTTTFFLLDGTYNVVCTKGSSSRTDPVTVGPAATTLDVPCSDLVVNVKAETGDVSVNSVRVFVAAGTVETKSSVVGTTKFFLLDGTYNVTCTKSSSSRTDPITVGPAATTLDVPCSDLVVNVKAETGDVSVNTVRVAVAAGTVETKSSVVGTTKFFLLDGTYNVTSTKGSYSRTDPITVGPAATTLDVPCSDLVVNVKAESGDVSVSSIAVRYGTSTLESRSSVTGTTTFFLLDGTYDVRSTKGSYYRTDPITVGPAATTLDVPCSDLVVNVKAETGDVSVSSVQVRVAAGSVETKSSVVGTTKFLLLDGTYNVTSTKGTFSRTDPVGVGPAATTLNVPCSDLVVNLYANGNTGWPLASSSVSVRFGTGAVETKSGVAGTTKFFLLDGTFDVRCTRNNASRTDAAIVGPAAATLNVPVARFRVAVVKANFSAQTSVTVAVITAGGGSVESRSGVSGSTDFSLLQSVGAVGAGPYTFRATKSSTTAQTSADANEGPPVGPAGQCGVVLMVPDSVPAGSQNFQVKVVKADFSGWADAPVAVWKGGNHVADGTTDSGGNAFFNLPAGGPYEFNAGDSSATASVVAIPAAAMVGTILMPTVLSGPPLCAFTWLPAEPAEGQQVQFLDQSVDGNPGGSIAAWAWDFGDGGGANIANPVHVFVDNGDYPVTLIVRNSYGQRSSTTQVVSVRNVPPTCSAGGSREARVGEQVKFVGEAQDPGTLDTLSFEWDFGDGQSASGQSAAHAYQAAGQHRVTLTVVDKDGGASVSRTWVQVHDQTTEDSSAQSPGISAPLEVAYVGDAVSQPDGTLTLSARLTWSDVGMAVWPTQVVFSVIDVRGKLAGRFFADVVGVSGGDEAAAHMTVQLSPGVYFAWADAGGRGSSEPDGHPVNLIAVGATKGALWGACRQALERQVSAAVAVWGLDTAQPRAEAIGCVQDPSGSMRVVSSTSMQVVSAGAGRAEATGLAVSDGVYGLPFRLVADAAAGTLTVWLWHGGTFSSPLDAGAMTTQ